MCLSFKVTISAFFITLILWRLKKLYKKIFISIFIVENTVKKKVKSFLKKNKNILSQIFGDSKYQQIAFFYLKNIKTISL